jgi:hypothetical protein
MTTVYLAVSSVNGTDYEVQAVFTRREDAEAFGLADGVREFELHDGPLEVRTWYHLRWYRKQPLREQPAPDGTANPYLYGDLRIWDGDPGRVEISRIADYQVDAEGWDLARVRSRLDELMSTTRIERQS